MSGKTARGKGVRTSGLNCSKSALGTKNEHLILSVPVSDLGIKMAQFAVDVSSFQWLTKSVQNLSIMSCLCKIRKSYLNVNTLSPTCVHVGALGPGWRFLRARKALSLNHRPPPENLEQNGAPEATR
jgi:hypothetical protein